MRLHKKQIRAIFLFKFKMGHKTAETTRNINTFDPGSANKCAVQWCFKKFHKGDESLEDEEPVASHRELTSVQRQWPMERTIKAHPVVTTREAAKGRSANHSTVQHLKQSGKVKKLSKWVPHELKIKNIIILRCHLLLLYATTMNHFSVRLWYVMKSGFYVTTSNSQLIGWTKKKFQSTSQSQNCTKKRSWSLFGGLLPVSSTTAFWILAKPLYLRSTLRKSMRCTENCNAGSRHQSTEKGPVLLQGNARPHVAQPALQKLNEWGNKVLPHPPHSPDLIQLTTTSSSISTAFCRENASTTSGRQKMLSKSLSNPKSQIFML